MSPEQFEIDLGGGYKILERDSVALNGMQVYRTPIANGPFVLMLPHGIAAMCEDGRTVHQYPTIDECRQDCNTLKELLDKPSADDFAERFGSVPVCVNESKQPPLTGHWRHGHGVICCGTLRIARSDFDTNPSPEFERDVLEWMCNTLNAAVNQ